MPQTQHPYMDLRLAILGSRRGCVHLGNPDFFKVRFYTRLKILGSTGKSGNRMKSLVGKAMTFYFILM